MRIFKEEAYPVFSIGEEDGCIPNVDIGEELPRSAQAEWRKVEQDYREWQQIFAELYEQFSVPAESASQP